MPSFTPLGDGCLKKGTERNSGLVFMHFEVSFAQTVRVKADVFTYLPEKNRKEGATQLQVIE